MKTAHLKSNRETARFLYPLAIAMVITLFLFYIDEGYYDFRWMKYGGNWVAFFIYVAVIYGAQLLFTLPLFRFVPRFILILGKIITIILIVLFLTLIVFK